MVQHSSQLSYHGGVHIPDIYTTASLLSMLADIPVNVTVNITMNTTENTTVSIITVNVAPVNTTVNANYLMSTRLSQHNRSDVNIDIHDEKSR